MPIPKRLVTDKLNANQIGSSFNEITQKAVALSFSLLNQIPKVGHSHLH
jgi:hypothetical protein